MQKGVGFGWGHSGWHRDSKSARLTVQIPRLAQLLANAVADSIDAAPISRAATLLFLPATVLRSWLCTFIRAWGEVTAETDDRRRGNLFGRGWSWWGLDFGPRSKLRQRGAQRRRPLTRCANWRRWEMSRTTARPSRPPDASRRANPLRIRRVWGHQQTGQQKRNNDGDDPPTGR